MTHIDDIVPSMLIFAINDHWIMKHKNKIKKQNTFMFSKYLSWKKAKDCGCMERELGRGLKEKDQLILPNP